LRPRVTSRRDSHRRIDRRGGPRVNLGGAQGRRGKLGRSSRPRPLPGRVLVWWTAGVDRSPSCLRARDPSGEPQRRDESGGGGASYAIGRTIRTRPLAVPPPPPSRWDPTTGPLRGSDSGGGGGVRRGRPAARRAAEPDVPRVPDGALAKTSKFREEKEFTRNRHLSGLPHTAPRLTLRCPGHATTKQGRIS
ncbi:hypothetical protein THAOC_35776, partial [Thalassiosira oceanica]